jgi:hypothetical protein
MKFKPEWEMLKKFSEKYMIHMRDSYSMILNFYEFESENINVEGIVAYPTIRINRQEYNGERNMHSILNHTITHANPHSLKKLSEFNDWYQEVIHDFQQEFESEKNFETESESESDNIFDNVIEI